MFTCASENPSGLLGVRSQLLAAKIGGACRGGSTKRKSFPSKAYRGRTIFPSHSERRTQFEAQFVFASQLRLVKSNVDLKHHTVLFFDPFLQGHPLLASWGKKLVLTRLTSSPVRLFISGHVEALFPGRETQALVS
jgi:hypothetical protein